MRTLKLHFPDDALPTLDTFLKQTKAARVFRRAQAVRNVVKGQRLQTVSDALQFTYSALRKWVHRFANQGTAGLVDRPRPGRPPKLTCELEKHLNRLVEQDPLEHGSVGLDQGIGHFMLFEADSVARAPAPPTPISPRTSGVASDRKSAPQPSFRQAA
jgi:Winged helix-turn helix